MTKNRSKNGTHRVQKPSKSLFFDFRKKGAIGIDVSGHIGHFWQKDHFCTLSTPYNYPWYLIKVSKMSKNDHFDPRVDSDPPRFIQGGSIWGFPLGCRLPTRLYLTELCIISWSEGQKWPKWSKIVKIDFFDIYHGELQGFWITDFMVLRCQNVFPHPYIYPCKKWKWSKMTKNDRFWPILTHSGPLFDPFFDHTPLLLPPKGWNSVENPRGWRVRNLRLES